MPELRALLVSYAFPPVGGAGVQRVAKLVKYLPEHGVTPAVLTVANPSVPVHDTSLLRDIPASTEIARARTFEPGYAAKKAAWTASSSPRSSMMQKLVRTAAGFAKNALVPDPQILWYPDARRALGARLRRKADDVVVISGPPFSQFLLAMSAHRAGVPVVLDYRDEWSTVRSGYEMTASPIARALGDRLEPALLRRATRVTTATPEFRDELLRTYPFLDPAHVVAIPNGYDRDDLPAARPVPPRDRFVLTYAGTVFRLTSVRTLMSAIRTLHAREPDLGRVLDVRFLGRIVDTERDAFEGMDRFSVQTAGYVPHDEVVAALSASHLVACVLDDVAGAERIYPAKIFELMMIGRPVLTIAPDGALARLARAHQLGDVVHPRDEPALVEALARRLRAFRDGDVDVAPAPHSIERFDRRALAGEFAQVLRSAAAPQRS